MHIRLWIIAIITATVLGAATGVQTTQAQVADEYEIIDVREAQCYRHVLDTDDRLCITRYALVDNDDILSVNGAFIKIENATGTLATIFAPVEDYGLACNYWTPDDASLPTWNATTTAFFQTNPFVTGSSTTTNPVTVTWNNTETAGGNFEETSIELTIDLPQIVFRLQQDSPDFDEDDLVSGVGITPLGKFFVEQCFEPLIQIASIAFILESEFAGDDHFVPDTPGFIIDAEEEGKQSEWSQEWATAWAFFGIPFNGAMIFLLVLGVGIIFFAIWKFDGNPKAGFFYIWPVMLATGYQGGLPFEAIVLLPAAIFVMGVALFLRHVMPVGG